MAGCACGGDDDDDDHAVDAATDATFDAPPPLDAGLDAWVPPLPDRCKPGGTAWEPGTPAFESATSDWGTDAMGVEGTRISMADVDGDGWTDAVVRRAVGQGDDFAEGGVRNNWLLRNVDGEHFEDVTQDSGLWAPREPVSPDEGRAGQIVVFGDVDNDGDLDAFVGLPATDPPSPYSSELMLNDGSGHFSFGPVDSEVRDDGLGLARSGAAFTDYDRDGNLDLWVTNSLPPGAYQPQPDELDRGDGQGGFTLVGEDLGIYTYAWSSTARLNEGICHTYAWSAAACDLNDDGTPELLVASYGRGASILWQGTRAAGGDVSYENRGIASGYAWDDRTDWTDNESARCWCKLHPDDEDCDGVPWPNTRCVSDADAFRWNHATDREPYRLGGNMGTTVCADVDNDGDMDLLVTSIVHWDVGSSSDPTELLINSGEPDVRFERPGNRQTGLEREHDLDSWNDGDMTAAVFDFDDDGRPDVLVASSDYPSAAAHLWHQESDGTFTEVPIDLGIDHHRAHGVGVADLDHDGDLDVLLGHSNARCEGDCYETFEVRVFRNVLGQDGNAVDLRLEGAAGTNRSAIGARVRVMTDAGTQTQEVGGGHGHYGMQRDMSLHFGLGAACQAEVRVRWPDADLTEETFMVQPGYRYAVRQGQGAEPIDP